MYRRLADKGALLRAHKSKRATKSAKKHLMTPKFPGWKPNYLQQKARREPLTHANKALTCQRLLVLFSFGRCQSREGEGGKWGPEEMLPPETRQRNQQRFSKPHPKRTLSVSRGCFVSRCFTRRLLGKYLLRVLHVFWLQKESLVKMLSFSTR